MEKSNFTTEAQVTFRVVGKMLAANARKMLLEQKEAAK